ncbi:hypothetical protein QUF80_03720 [Desulfococcaceae bacterium HSG8]|nr:hypothetical protein [Desulfococcaceae bacterium HSG8]
MKQSIKVISNKKHTRSKFVVPPSGGITPPKGGTTNCGITPPEGGTTNCTWYILFRKSPKHRTLNTFKRKYS